MRLPGLSLSATVVMVASVAASVAGVGCGNPFVVTDSFTPPPAGAFSSAPDALHDYAVGTDVGLDVRAAGLFVNMNVVKVVSKNPELLTVSDQTIKDGIIHVTLHAVAVGTAGLDFLDDRQRPLEERVIEVKQPDEVVLTVNVDTDKGFTIPAIDTAHIVLAEGGTVTFRVAYKNGGKELKGVGILTGSATTPLTIQNPTRPTPDREFVTIIAPGAVADLSDLTFQTAGLDVTTVKVEVASLDTVATIQLDEGELPSWKNNGDLYSVWAKAFTEGAAPVWGAPFVWTFDSAGIEGSGDIVTYTYQGGERRRVQVSSGSAVEDLTVEAKAGTARVGSTASPGCASTPASPVALAGVLLAFSLGRRRAARRGTLPS